MSIPRSNLQNLRMPSKNINPCWMKRKYFSRKPAKRMQKPSQRNSANCSANLSIASIHSPNYPTRLRPSFTHLSPPTRAIRTPCARFPNLSRCPCRPAYSTPSSRRGPVNWERPLSRKLQKQTLLQKPTSSHLMKVSNNPNI